MAVVIIPDQADERMSGTAETVEKLLSTFADDLECRWNAALDRLAAVITDLRVGKGDPVRVFENQQGNGVSSKAIDCRRFTALHVLVLAGGGSPSATVAIYGGDSAGAAQTAQVPLPDVNAQKVVTASIGYVVSVPTAFAAVGLTNYTSGLFTVVVTPYVA